MCFSPILILMKAIKFFLASMLTLASFSLFAEGYAIYADKIRELERRGHIHSADAEQALYALKVRDRYTNAKMRNASRSVASAIGPASSKAPKKSQKVIKFINEPIEVSLSNNQ